MDAGRIGQLLSDAKSHADSGDMLIASQLYTRATEIGINSAAAWYGLGVVQTTRGYPEESIAAFERAYEINPDHAPTAANLAILLENIDPERATVLANFAINKLGRIEQLTNLVESNETDIDDVPLLDSSAVNTIDDNIEEPIENMAEDDIPLLQSREVLEDAGDILIESRKLPSLDVVIDQAEAMIRDGNPEEALDLLRQRSGSDGSTNYRLWSLCATSLSMIGHDQEALESIEYAIAIGDDRAKTHFNHSQILRKFGKTNEAMQSVANALISEPNHINSLISLGEMRYDAGNLDEAVSIWEKAQQIEPNNDISIRIKNARLSLQNHLDEPISENSTIVDSFANKIAMARELTGLGDHVNSVKLWKELLENNRDSSEIWNGMADSLSAAGHIDRAFQCRQKAKFIETGEISEVTDTEDEELDLITAGNEAKENMEKYDNSPEENINVSIEWYNKGINLLAQERGSEALSSFEKAIGGAPRDELELRVKSQSGRGHALYQMGKYGDSIRSYHTAISMDPEGVSGKLLYNMGSSYASLELFEDAVKCFIQALDRGLDAHDRDLCKKQLSRCKLLAKEQARIANR